MSVLSNKERAATELRHSKAFPQYLATERRPLPLALTARPTYEVSTLHVPIERYTSPEFAQDEMKHVWMRVWQMACRLEDIPEVGDRIRYDIGEKSVVIVRVSATEVKAYINACLHRGRLLCDGMESGEKLRCRFHGWTYSLNGKLDAVTDWWDFPHVKRHENSLPEVKVDTWGGFVFVNFSADPMPLAEQLEVIPEHFKSWRFESRIQTVHMKKKIRCNWKVAIEAIIEAYHLPGTHAQLTAYSGEYEYLPLGRHVNRVLGLMGVPHPLYRDHFSETDIFSAMNRDFRFGVDDAEVPAGQTARDLALKETRAALQGVAPEVADCELIDLIQYFLFPNLFIFGGLQSPGIFRLLPGETPDTCIMEWTIVALAPDGQRSERKEPIELGFDDRWSDPGLVGDLALVFDQDTANMEGVQAGLKTTVKAATQLSVYQESGIRLLHDTLCYYIERGKSNHAPVVE